jgi:hypothetical protein
MLNCLPPEKRELQFDHAASAAEAIDIPQPSFLAAIENVPKSEESSSCSFTTW